MKVLVVVDYQNDFVTGSLGCGNALKIEDAVAEKVEEYHSRGDMIVFTKDVHDPDGYLQTQEGKKLPVPHCVTEEGRAIYGKVAKYCNDSNTVIKDRFGSEDLCARLGSYTDIESIEVCGVVSSICVLSDAVLLKTHFREVPIIIDARCVAAPDDAMNEKALDIMENLQMEIINRSE